MSFSHTNKIRYIYSAGGVDNTTEVSAVETGTGEANVSETWTLGGSPLTQQILDHFTLEEKGQVLSVFLLVEGCNGTLVDDSDVAVAVLTKGVPVVWSKGGGTSFPVGSTNPMNDGMEGLKFTPSGADAVDGASVTLTVRVLFDVSA